MMKNKNSNYALDEMQEKKLLKLEETGFWLLFWLLLAAIVIQVIMKPDMKTIAGEAVILMIGAIYLSFSCIRSGIWSKGIAPTTKNNILFSIIPALILGLVLVVRVLVLHDAVITFDAVRTIVIFVVVTYLVCLGALEITRVIYQRKRTDLDSETEIEEQAPDSDD